MRGSDARLLPLLGNTTMLGIVFIHLLFSVILLALAFGCCRRRGIWWTAGFMLPWLAITVLARDLPLIFLNSVLLLFVAAGGRLFAARPRTAFFLLFGATGLSYACFVGWALSKSAELTRRWTENAPRSLEKRLAYEDSINRRPSPEHLTAVSEQSLEKFGDGLRDHGRRYMLRRLRETHFEALRTFLETEGFGPTRTPSFRGKAIDLPPLPYLPQQEPPPQDLATRDCSPGEMLPEKRPPTGNQPPDDKRLANADEKAGDEKGNPAEGNVTPHDSERVRGPQPPTTDQLQEFHLAGTIDFVNAPGFGYIPSQKGSGTPFGDLSRVMGFQPHAFRKPPGIRRAPGTQATWLIDRLELVSLLKHSEPAVYISKHLPRMDELSEATTRPLSDFESQALPKLRAGEELVIDTHPGEIRMLGAVRAITRCLDCHRAREGDLLGAFTYRLLSTPPPAAKAVNDPAL